jgi:hypothetical protein
MLRAFFCFIKSLVRAVKTDAVIQRKMFKVLHIVIPYSIYIIMP